MLQGVRRPRRHLTRRCAAVLGLLGALALAGCAGDAGRTSPTSTGASSTGPSSTGPSSTGPSSTGPSSTRPTTSSQPAPGTTPPSWLGTRILPTTAAGIGEIRPTPRALRNRRFTLPDALPPLPGRGFASRVISPAPDDVLARSTWSPDCPVGRDELSWVRVAFRGFDGQRHTGELLVSASADTELVEVFRALYAADFPIEQMTITTTAERDAPPTGDGNDTGAFNCRAVTGGTSYSQHAYGLAIDVNPFQNPYAKGEVVLPELASAYLDRGALRAGMITPDGPVVRAFAAIGWEWGGDWRTLKDYQHFSRNGR